VSSEAATVEVVEAVRATPQIGLDSDSQDWLRDLRAEGETRDAAIANLHALLLRAARFEIGRRRPMLALVSVLRRLDDFRGASRFTTWAYKFALLEAAVKLRKRSWQGREVPLEPEAWSGLASVAPGPEQGAEQSELLSMLQASIAEALTPHQRSVLVALALNGVPIDVLAERLNTTRGALYKTLHDARRKLRQHLERDGYSVEQWLEE
jgi:RNA polymerase sigma-70 factor (ECF subfamily)